MLTTSKNIRYSYVRRLVALPLLVLTMAVFSLQVNAKAESKTLPAASPVSKEKNDNFFIPKQEVPKFPGGPAGWQQFLQKTANFKKVVEKGGPPGKYVVKLTFIVDKEGDVRDVEALTDPGYGAKEDAIRVLLSSPKWAPATQNGKKVIYRDKISITYMVSND